MSWIFRTEGGLLSQSTSLNQQVDANQLALGVSQARAAQLDTRTTDYAAALNAKNVAEDAYRAAVDSFQLARAALISDMSELNQFVQQQPQVTPELLKQVGFPVYTRPVRGKPVTPVNLTARVGGQNEVFLRWSRTGNPRSAIFNVQIKVGAGAWLPFGSTTGTRLNAVVGQPGQPTQFRVIAQRGSEFSQPSVAISVWATGLSGETVTLKAA